jgi:hypothetical protein
MGLRRKRGAEARGDKKVECARGFWSFMCKECITSYIRHECRAFGAEEEEGGNWGQERKAPFERFLGTTGVGYMQGVSGNLKQVCRR